MPEINIVGTYAPPFGFEKNPEELDKINNMISEAHPDLRSVPGLRWIFWQDISAVLPDG